MWHAQGVLMCLTRNIKNQNTAIKTPCQPEATKLLPVEAQPCCYESLYRLDTSIERASYELSAVVSAASSFTKSSSSLNAPTSRGCTVNLACTLPSAKVSMLQLEATMLTCLRASMTSWRKVPVSGAWMSTRYCVSVVGGGSDLVGVVVEVYWVVGRAMRSIVI